MKAFLPVLREKKRYLVFEAIGNISQNELFSMIKASFASFFGILGLAKASPIIMEDYYKDNKGIIRVNRGYIDHARASLALVQGVIVQSKYVGGSIRSAKEHI